MSTNVYKESKIQKYEVRSGMSETDISKETFKAKYGENTTTEQLRDKISSVKNVFASKYGSEKIEKAAASKVKTAYKDNVSREGKLGFVQKSKRGKAAVEKVKLQNNLIHEQELMLEQRRNEETDTMKYISAEELDTLKDVYKDPEELQSVREWLFSKNRAAGFMEVKNNLVSNDADSRISGFQDIFKANTNIDLKKYAYSNDTDFVSGFAIKYNEICKIAALKPMLDMYNKLTDNNADIINVSKIAANIEFFEKLKEEYEDRMKLISSPYYALLAAKDLKKYNSDEDVDPEADPAFKEFVALYIKLSKSSLGKGKSEDYQDTFNTILKEKEQTRYDQDRKRIDKYYTGVELEDFRDLDEEEKAVKIEELFKAKVEFERKQYSDKPDDFLEKVRFESGGNILEGIEAPQLEQMEKKLLGVFNDHSILGNDLDERVYDRFSDTFKEFIDARKDYISTFKGWDLLNRAQTYYGADQYSGTFKSSEEFAKIGALIPLEGFDPKYENDTRKKKEIYIDLFLNCYKILSAADYQISVEETKLKDDRVANAIEDERVRIENKYYSDHPEIKKEDRVRIDFKKFTVLGKEFTDYKTNNIFNALAEGKIKLTQDQERLLLPYLMQLDGYQKDFCVIKSMFGTEGGEKKLTEMIRNSVNVAKMKEIEGKIKNVLGEQS